MQLHYGSLSSVSISDLRLVSVSYAEFRIYERTELFSSTAMAMALHTPEGSTPSTSSPAVAPASSHSSKPPRVLACTLCHQRKVKCDRKFPCSNCIRSRAECVPATAVRPRRRRRVTERDLLERLGRCEKLLRRHNIEFEPLGKDASVEIPHPSIETGDASDDGRQSEGVWTGPPSPSTSATEKLDKMVQYEAKYAHYSTLFNFHALCV